MASPEDSSEGETQEERLQALIDSSPLALVEFGLDTRIRLWNPAAEHLLARPAEDALGRRVPQPDPGVQAELHERERRGVDQGL